jgi:hypothetical protein
LKLRVIVESEKKETALDAERECIWGSIRTEVLVANADSLNLAIMKRSKNQIGNNLFNHLIQNLHI